jgi:hypothetical protein
MLIIVVFCNILGMTIIYLMKERQNSLKGMTQSYGSKVPGRNHDRQAALMKIILTFMRLKQSLCIICKDFLLLLGGVVWVENLQGKVELTGYNTIKEGEEIWKQIYRTMKVLNQ